MPATSLRRTAALAASLAALVVLGPARAEAALGAGAGSVARDREALKATLSTTTTAAYVVHELATPGGKVRQYQAIGGQVFAVTWQGKKAPDLRQLLGDWFERYSAAAAATTRRGGHHVLSIDTPDLVASAVRFQRGFQGRAILPALVPPGVTRDELR